MCMPGACRGQEWASNRPELELQMLISWLMGVGNQTWIFFKNVCSYQLSHLSGPIFLLVSTTYRDVCACRWMCACECRYPRTPGMLGPQELELQTFVNCLIWMLRTELSSSGRASKLLITSETSLQALLSPFWNILVSVLPEPSDLSQNITYLL